MNEPVRVLHITEMLQAGGIESFIMNVYRNIDKSKVQFDFLITRDENEFYDEEIKKLGGRKLIIDIDKNKNVFIRVFLESIQLYKILKNSDYNIIQVHSGTPLRIFYLFAAKFAGVKTRIYHSHSAEVKGPHSMITIKKYVFKFLKLFFEYAATDYFACSEEAGKWMYSKKLIQNNKVKVIHNGIELNKFKFNSDIREKYRQELNLKDNFVIEHIGRFTHQKNHNFLIDVFDAIYKIDKSARLLLIGEGELKKNIQLKVNDLGLAEVVIFLGIRSDVNNIMQAMDVFLLPSNYEGLPVVGVEAQASGLMTVFSENITREIDITENSMFISLNEPSNIWASKVMNKKNSTVRGNSLKDIIKYGYNIEYIAKYLEGIYINQ